MLQVHELIDNALHHVSAGVAYPYHHAMLLEHLGQLGQEGTLVLLLLLCGPVGR
jgi:hypothetical protein